MLFNYAERTLSTGKGFNITQAQDLITSLGHLGANDLYRIKLSGSSFNPSHPAQAPQQLQFSTNKNIYSVGDISLTNAKVYDGDGIRDLSRVHFQLKQDGGNWVDIGNATNFTADSHDNHWGDFSFKIPSGKLTHGNYQLSAVAYSKSGAASNNVQLSFKVDQAPQNLQFSTDKQSYSNSDVLSLTQAKVYDGDGASDLSRVHFQLKKDGGTWQDLSDVTSFTADSHDNHWANFNLTYSLKGLTPGQYELSAVAYDKLNVASTSVQQSFTAAAPDWFDQHIQNTALRNEARTDFTRDGMLTRNDMIAIFKKAEAPGVVDATELTDLRTLVSSANYLKLPDYVSDLSNKVVNGDTANAHYQGGSLGNLAAGSSATQLDDLINKWFLGSDRPSTPYTYQYANGSLFQNGISYQDVKQGAVGDCYFLAGLAETAFRSPSTIQNMFIDNGDNTYTVRFYDNGVADYVTVDKYLPTTAAGTLAYANMGASSSAGKLWVALAEKAYAQLDESGWIGHDSSNSYQGIASGWDGYADSQITGGSATYNYLNFNAMVSAFNAGDLMGVNSKVSGTAADIAANHAYAVVGYNSSSQEFTLFNPWGVNGGYENGQLKPGTLQLSWSELTASFDGWTNAIA